MAFREKVRRRWRASALILLLLTSSPAFPQVLTETFSAGTNQSDDWTLSGGIGRRDPTGHDQGGSLSVTGSGNDSTYWRRPVPELKANSTYLLRFWTRRAPGSSEGTIICGLDSCNRDVTAATEWEPRSLVFTTPDDVTNSFLRLGQWRMKGTVFFSDLTVAFVQPVFRRSGAVALGSGERLSGSEYAFVAPLADEETNAARPLVSHTAAFNTSRWVFTGGSEVIYRLGVPGTRQLGARCSLRIGSYFEGECLVAVSRDGETWREVARLKDTGEWKVDLPADMFPAPEIWVRMQGAQSQRQAGNSGPGAFQVRGFQYTAQMESPHGEAHGRSLYAEIAREDQSLAVSLEDLGSLGTEPPDTVRLTLRPAASASGEASVEVTAQGGGRAQTFSTGARVGDVPGRQTTVSVPYKISATGSVGLAVTVDLVAPTGPRRVFSASADSYVSEYFATDYGSRLASIPGIDLWWCESTYKVSPRRLAPEASSAGVALSAAGRERVAFQIVLRPQKDIGVISVSATDFRGASGAFVPKSALVVKRIGTVNVTVPSDRIGLAARWPDPLLPMTRPWTPVPQENNVLWCTVSVPPDAAPGDYRGSVQIQSAIGNLSVPVDLHVWAFTLPQETSLRSGFGIDPGSLRTYQNLQSDSAMAGVWDLYMQDFARHRLSPFHPMALAPVQMSVAHAPELRLTLDFDDFDKAAHRCLDVLGFNSFVVDVPGLGGGRFPAYDRGSLAGYAAGSLEYETLMRQYGQQLQDHLEKKGWLSKAYVYWYDEPRVEDYPFVAQGMELLRRSAPKLKRMLTAPVAPALEGHVDLWCPVTSELVPEEIARRQARGEEVWWYVCTTPKEPFVGEFIDHPAIEPRMWLWQTWKYGVQGILIWDTDWWSSPSQFTDVPQNPWEDPMSYAYPAPGAWGNGDGRFFYPPNRQDGNRTEQDASGPVDSLRWEILGEGVQDWEYFNILAGLVRKAESKGDRSPDLLHAKELLTIPDSICRDMTHYTTDPQLLYRYRERIARVIELLLQ